MTKISRLPFLALGTQRSGFSHKSLPTFLGGEHLDFMPVDLRLSPGATAYWLDDFEQIMKAQFLHLIHGDE